MPDKKNRSFGRQHAVNLNTKIRLGFFLTVLPLFFIVGATYFPLKNIAFDNSSRQIILISSSGQEKFNTFFRTSHLFFREWVEGDVFRLATEFDAWEDLKYQMDSIQRVHEEFPVMLMLDKKGVILQESRLFKKDSASLTGRKVPYFDKVLNAGSGPGFVIKNSPTLPTRGGAPFLVFVHRTQDSIGNVNGYFLGFLDLFSLQIICKETLEELSSSMLPGSQVAVVGAVSHAIISWETNEKGHPPELPVPITQLLAESSPGRIKIFHTEQGVMHMVYLPLDFELDANTQKKSQAPLYLIISVKEKEIMDEVSGTLMLTIGIAGIGLLLALVFSALTVKILTSPINGLVRVLQKYTAGDSSVRADVQSRDEIGYFAREFNSMLEKIENSSVELQESEARYRNLFGNLQKAVSSKNYQYRFSLHHDDADDLVESLNLMMETLENADLKSREEDWIKTGLNQLSEQISGNYELDALCKKAISFIAQYMSALTGTIFVRRQDSDDEGVFFELLAAYAYEHEKTERYGYREKEGLLGQVVKEKKRMHLKNIPDKYLTISSSLGSGAPLEILIFPLIYEGEVQGVVELGINFKLEEKHLDLADQLGRVMGVAIYSAIVNDQFKKQSENLLRQQRNLQKANRQLEAQNLMLQEADEPDA